MNRTISLAAALIAAASLAGHASTHQRTMPPNAATPAPALAPVSSRPTVPMESDHDVVRCV